MRKIFYPFVLLLMMLSYGCAADSEYANALPKDAAAVARINMKAVYTKTKLNDKSQADAMNRFRAMIKSGLEGADNMIDKIFENGKESGIDFGSDIYFFSGKNMSTLGCVARLDSKGKFEELIQLLHHQGICTDIEQTDGCQWVAMGQWLIAYNNTCMVALSDSQDKEAEKLKRRASMLLRQESEEGFSATKDFELLHQKQADINMWMSLDLLPREVIYPVTMGVSGELNLNEIKGMLSVHFETGKTVIELNSISNNKVLNSISQELDHAFGKLNGKYAEAFAANTPIWMSANINGKELFDLICANPTLRHKMEGSIIPLDYKAIFGAISGECALVITNVLTKEFILTGDVTGTDFLQTFEQLKPLLAMTNGQTTLQNINEHEYVFYTSDASTMGLRRGPIMLWTGVRNGKFYLTNNGEIIGKRVLGQSLADKAWGKNIKGNQYYSIINMQAIRTSKSLNALGGMIGHKLVLALNGLEYITVSKGNESTLKLELVMTDKEKNLLQNLVNIDF